MIELSRSVRSLGLAIWLGLAIVWTQAPRASGEFDSRSEFVSRLISPMTIAIESAPFRASLERVAHNAQINVWFDRTIDPSASISPGSVGPTVYDCLEKLANERNCVVFAVENVVLIGPAERVDATASVLLELSKNLTATSQDSTLATVHWDLLSTPNEALAAANGKDNASGLQVKLPHDLWPETNWTFMDHRIAAALVLAQFGLKLSQDKRTTEPLETTAAPATYPYKTDAVPPEARKAVKSVDTRAGYKSEPGGINVTTTATGHRLFSDALLAALAAARAPIARGNPIEKLNQDQRQFTFRLVNKSAKDVFAYLANTADVGFVVDDDAQSSCEKLVSFEAKDATLVDLIKKVAALAKVNVVWESDRFRVTRTQP